jgi:myo-inositol-1(or 4)-monophosphatase
MVSHSGLITVMQRAARKAAPRLRRDFGEVEQLQVNRKSPADFVSMADHRAEQTIVEELRHARPDWRLTLEEGGAIEGDPDKPRWIVDPLDGTTNFLHGVPHFAISMALERDGEIIAGLIYDPTRDEMFTAEKGAGAFLNDRRLRVSARRQLGEALIGTGIPFRGRGDHPMYVATLAAVMAQTSGVRRLGSAALDLAYVAAGRYDGFWEFGLAPWDVAAGLLIIREAGGYISDFAGGQSMLATGDVLAANTHLHLPLAALIKDAMRGAAAKG